MKIILLIVSWLLPSVTMVAQKYELVTNANPWFSTMVKNTAEVRVPSGTLISQIPKKVLYTPGTYKDSASTLTINEAAKLAISLTGARRNPLLLNGLNIIRSDGESVAVLVFRPRYIFFGKIVCRARLFSKVKILRKSKHTPIQVLLYTE